MTAPDPPPGPGPEPTEGGSWAAARDVDAACDRFEVEWNAGMKPDRAAFLADASASIRPDLARELEALELALRKRGEPPPGLGPGSVLGEYEILNEIGRGGMGVVYKAQHRRMGRAVALKVLLGASRDAPRRFGREVLAAARLTNPHIIAALDAGEHQGRPYLVLEFVEGVDLARHVKARGPLPVAEAAAVILQAARGLEYAHARGVVHRDVKPSNLLRDAAGTVKLLDLGLARLLDAERPERIDDTTELTLTGSFLGSVDYIAPEQALDSRRADARSDLYSLGCTLHTLLIGRPPYGGATPMERLVAHREAPIPSLRAARPEVPEALDAIFARLVAKKPEDRYPSASALIGDLGSEIGPAPKRRAVILAAGSAATLGLLAWAAWMFAPRRPPPDRPQAPPIDPSRRLALFTLQRHGALRVVGIDADITALADLPPGPLAFVWIDLQRPVDGDPKRYPPVTDADLAAFDGVTKVENLHLGHTSVTDLGLARLSGVDGLTRLYLTDLRGVTDSGLVALERLPRLQQLLLMGTSVSDGAMASIRRMPDLRYLNLTRTGVTDAGLTGLSEMTRLEGLDLEGTAVTDAGIATLSRLVNLTRLNLAHTAMSDQGLAALDGLVNLTDLIATGTRVTEDGAKRFRESHSACKVAIGP